MAASTTKTTKTTKSTKNPSAVEVAEKNLADVQTTVASLIEELAQLQQEHYQIEEQIESGSLVADIDRKAELEDLIGRRITRLADLEGRVLAYAEHALAQAELDALAADQADGVTVHHEQYLTATAAARAKIAQGIEELKAATDQWEEFSSPIIRRATVAGLTEGKADPLARVLVAGTGQSAHLVIDGEPIITPTIHSTLAEAVSGADEHLAGTIARGQEVRRMGLPISQIGF